MSYLLRNLLPDEKIVNQAVPHWVIFRWAIVCLVVAVWMFVSTASLGGAFFLILAIVSAVGAWVQSGATQLALTDSRVVGKIGIIRQQSIDVPLQKIDGVRVDQSLLGGVLNYGTIYVGNTTHAVKFEYIAKPMQFRNNVLMQVKQLTSTLISPPAIAP
jgi:uncharacterized membrane protein YdbT with pleckstrin-like domain